MNVSNKWISFVHYLAFQLKYFVERIIVNLFLQAVQGDINTDLFVGFEPWEVIKLAMIESVLKYHE